MANEIPGGRGWALCCQQHSSAVGLQLPLRHSRQPKLGLDHLTLQVQGCMLSHCCRLAMPSQDRHDYKQGVFVASLLYVTTVMTALHQLC